MIYHASLVKRVRDVANPHLRLLRVRRFFAELFTAKQYGPPNVDSCPHRTARPLLERVGNDSGQSVVRSFYDKIPRKAEEGEISIYATGIVKGAVKRVSEISLEVEEGVDAEGNASSVGKVHLNGAEHVGIIKIVELTAAINRLIAQLQAHTHGASVVPSQTFTLFDKAAYENTTVLHGSGSGI